jgi:methyl-galactoside transport system substrate-binding protein
MEVKMRNIGRVLITIIATFVVVSILIGSNLKIDASIITKKPVKVAVVVYNANDLYISQIIKGLQDIQKKNEEKVKFTFFSSDQDNTKQGEIIDTILEKKEFDMLYIALVDEVNHAQEVIDKVKENNMPVIVFHREPYGTQKDAIKSYTRAIFIGTDPAEGGILQGKLLIDLWNKNKANMDKNKDNIMQYIMLKGRSVDLHEIGRTKNSILMVNNEGIKTKELASQFANWNEEQARVITEALFLKYGDKIEVIVANNDAMAIGAIKALQDHGYNLGDMKKTITVTGVDGVPEAIELINKGFMAGTVIQDAKGVAEALYACGMNLYEHKNPIEGTPYKLDETGVSIRIPYKIYMIN